LNIATWLRIENATKSPDTAVASLARDQLAPFVLRAMTRNQVPCVASLPPIFRTYFGGFAPTRELAETETSYTI
jgi:hypothetical protein